MLCWNPDLSLPTLVATMGRGSRRWPMRTMSRSALRVTREALAVGRAAPPTCGSPCSRHDYTQPQLFALLVPKQFLRTDHRGLVALVAEWRELRRALGLRKVPHDSTLAHAARRLLARSAER